MIYESLEHLHAAARATLEAELQRAYHPDTIARAKADLAKWSTITETEARAMGLLATSEPGADGRPQTLLPGVDPVTTGDRVAVAAAKPHGARKGSQRPQRACNIGLFDDTARNQPELF
jgi:hypothetical protein